MQLAQRAEDLFHGISSLRADRRIAKWSRSILKWLLLIQSRYGSKEEYEDSP